MPAHLQASFLVNRLVSFHVALTASVVLYALLGRLETRKDFLLTAVSHLRLAKLFFARNSSERQVTRYGSFLYSLVGQDPFFFKYCLTIPQWRNFVWHVLIN